MTKDNEEFETYIIPVRVPECFCVPGHTCIPCVERERAKEEKE